MTETVIKVENLTKEYRILHENKDPYKKFSDTLIDFSKKCIMPWKFFNSKEVEMFKALSDVNFEIKKGEKIAIIGRNGAGKSTLLKVLSRITEPTEGTVKIKGRVASLLEVGTGFHPELTGRENIFLNGAILGMTKKEIQAKFNDIVEFSGCEKFLDTPVKRYSSGMRVRLGFAVAAHLESEILIVDEVLAVGDAEFQKKCLGKMDEIAKGEGRTIIFVSHSMSAVQSLCETGIVLDAGKIKYHGDISTSIDNYFDSFSKFETKDNKISLHDKNEKDKSEIEFVDLSYEEDNLLVTEISNNKDVSLALTLKVKEKVNNSKVVINIYNSLGVQLCSFIEDMEFSGIGTYKLKLNFFNQLQPGKYKMNITAKNNFVLFNRCLDLPLSVSGEFNQYSGSFSIDHKFEYNLESGE